MIFSWRITTVNPKNIHRGIIAQTRAIPCASADNSAATAGGPIRETHRVLPKGKNHEVAYGDCRRRYAPVSKTSGRAARPSIWEWYGKTHTLRRESSHLAIPPRSFEVVVFVHRIANSRIVKYLDVMGEEASLLPDRPCADELDVSKDDDQIESPFGIATF